MFVHTDRNKLHARQRYIVTQVSGNMVKLRRFSENLISHREYDATLQEIYKVPSIDEYVLPSDQDDDSSDDNTQPLTNPQKAREKHNLKQMKVRKKSNPTVVAASPSSNDVTEAEHNSYSSDESETDDEKDEDDEKEEYKDDKTWKMNSQDEQTTEENQPT